MKSNPQPLTGDESRSAALNIKRRRILSVASGGGHFVQLLRLRPALAGHEVVYVTTLRGYERDVAPSRLHVVHDASRWDKIGLLRMFLRMAWIMLRERPHIVITTGAAPGYFALRLGKLFGAKCIWVDSIANVDELSMSGRLASKHADLFLTQWSDLACDGGPEFRGAVL